MNLKPTREWVERVTKQATRFSNFTKASENDLKLIFLKELKNCRCYASTSFFFQKHGTSSSIKSIPYDGICCIDFFGITFYEKKNQEKPVFAFSYDFLTFVVGNLDTINFGFYDSKEKMEHQIILTTSRAREICEDALGYLEMRLLTNKRHLYAGIYLREQSVEKEKDQNFKDDVVDERKKKCMDALMDHSLLPITHPSFLFQKDSLLIKCEVSRIAYQKRRKTIMKSSVEEIRKTKQSDVAQSENGMGLSEIKEEDTSLTLSGINIPKSGETSRPATDRNTKENQKGLDESQVVDNEKEEEKQKIEEEIQKALNTKKDKKESTLSVEPPKQIVTPNPVMPNPPKPGEEPKGPEPQKPAAPQETPLKAVDIQGRRRTIRGKIMLNKGKEEESTKPSEEPAKKPEEAPPQPPKEEENPVSNTAKLNKAIGGALSKMPPNLRKKGRQGNKPTNEDDEIFKVEERRNSRLAPPPPKPKEEEKKAAEPAPPPPAPPKKESRVSSSFPQSNRGLV